MTQFFHMHGMKRVVGAIDGTHVCIKKPVGDAAPNFMNRKSRYSINVQVCLNMKCINMKYMESQYSLYNYHNTTLKSIFKI